MNRRTLVLTAWIMVALFGGWVRVYFWPNHAHLTHPHAHLRFFTNVILLLFNIVEFVCISYYVRGRNWARIAVLLASIVAVLGMLWWNHDDTPGHLISVAWAVLGIFFLYWLNTRSVREFFQRGPANVELP